MSVCFSASWVVACRCPVPVPAVAPPLALSYHSVSPPSPAFRRAPLLGVLKLYVVPSRCQIHGRSSSPPKIFYSPLVGSSSFFLAGLSFVRVPAQKILLCVLPLWVISPNQVCGHRTLSLGSSRGVRSSVRCFISGPISPVCLRYQFPLGWSADS